MSSYSEGQTHQLADAMEAAGLTAKHVTRLGQSSALLENLRRVLDGEAVISPIEFRAPAKPAPIPVMSILELVSRTVIPATTGKFIAKDKFVINTKRNAPVKIRHLGDNFKSWFLRGEGKQEDPITEQTLQYHRLRQSSIDGPIIVELGGEAEAETTLSQMFSLMENQKNGEDGVLLNNGYANIFYIRDSAGVLRAVNVLWGDGCWRVHADSVESPIRWSGGYRVFSRNSLESLEPLASTQA